MIISFKETRPSALSTVNILFASQIWKNTRLSQQPRNAQRRTVQISFENENKHKMLLAERSWRSLTLPLLDRYNISRGKFERGGTACACSLAFLLPHFHLMMRKRSKMKRSSLSSEMTPHHFQTHHHHHHHHHLLPQCSALPLALKEQNQDTNSQCVLDYAAQVFVFA